MGPVLNPIVAERMIPSLEYACSTRFNVALVPPNTLFPILLTVAIPAAFEKPATAIFRELLIAAKSPAFSLINDIRQKNKKSSIDGQHQNNQSCVC